ncbi:MAG: hypothetical protein AAB316_16390, partial [Bacteroidota bacterium]
EEAIETLETSLANVATGLEEAAKIAGDYSAESDTSAVTYCNTTHDTTWAQAYTTQTGAGSYTATWGFKINCNQIFVPVSIDLNSDATGTYQSLLLTGTETGEGDYLLEGLLPSAANYEVNGDYHVESSVTSKTGLKNTYSVHIQLAVTDVILDKASFEIQAGTGDVELTATSPKGQSVTFTGTVVFNGNGTLTLTVNGKSYTIEY